MERIGNHTRFERWGVQRTANAILDLGWNYFAPKNRPYFVALLKLVATDPEAFRTHAYSFAEVRFCDFVKSKSGALRSCRAYYATGPYIRSGEEDMS